MKIGMERWVNNIERVINKILFLQRWNKTYDINDIAMSCIFINFFVVGFPIFACLIIDKLVGPSMVRVPI